MVTVHCLKQDKVTFTYKQLVNIYIVYEINLRSYLQGADFTWGNFLFGAVKLTKNADPDKYSYSKYDIEFDARRSSSLFDGSSFCQCILIIKGKVYWFLVKARQMI